MAALLPAAAWAQDTGISNTIGGLQAVLDQLYTELIPQCSHLIGIAQALAGFATLWFIALRVWRSIANAEPVDVFPLLRPFVIGFAISIFPSVIGLINGVMQPTVTGTAALVGDGNAAIGKLLQEKEAALKKTQAYLIYNDDGGHQLAWEFLNNHPGTDAYSMVANFLAFQSEKAVYNVRNKFKLWLSEGLQVLYEAAALCINTLRIFNLIVLAILGPLVFAISLFEGFGYTLRVWLARYLNVFLWLPVANIFAAILTAIQTHMLELDLAQLQASGATYFSATDAGYLVFLVIGIFGYFSIPSMTNHIIHSGGGGALLTKITSIGGSVLQRSFGGAKNIMGTPGTILGGYGSVQKQSLATRLGRAYGKAQFQRNKITGKNP